MKKIQTLKQIQKLDKSGLKAYLTKKTKSMMEEYNVDNLNNIGYFVVLEKEEIEQFTVNKMEFVEVLQLAEETYLHGVKILSDSYGEDIFLPIEVVKCPS